MQEDQLARSNLVEEVIEVSMQGEVLNALEDGDADEVEALTPLEVGNDEA